MHRAVADGNHRGCVPFDLFNPVRAGQLRVRRLWLIDNFGRALPVLGAASDDSDQHLDTGKRLRPEQLIRAHGLISEADNQAGWCSLHPRLLAPARLALRWCSATDHQVDADHDSANQPLIGWLLPEHLDNRLALYSAEGQAIGSLNIDGALWCGAPGPNYELSPQHVLPAGPLLHLIEGLITLVENAGSRAPLQAFLDAVDDMTQHILPNQHEQHAGLALLMGRPLAIVRATVALELAVPPPRDQRIAAFVSPLDGPPRSDGGLAALRVPVKLGHRLHLDDGLVGYFIGASDAPQTYSAFYLEPPEPASDDDGNREPVTFAAPVVAATRDSLTVSVNGGPVLLTMIIDPRAPVHAATGLLPTKAIELPAAMYAQALSRLAVSFPVGALLGPRANPKDGEAEAPFPVPTPEEPGFAWQFTHRAGPAWPQRAVAPVPSAATALAQTHDVFDGWLLLQPVAVADGVANKPGGDEGPTP